MRPNSTRSARQRREVAKRTQPQPNRRHRPSLPNRPNAQAVGTLGAIVVYGGSPPLEDRLIVDEPTIEVSEPTQDSPTQTLAPPYPAICIEEPPSALPEAPEPTLDPPTVEDVSSVIEVAPISTPSPPPTQPVLHSILVHHRSTSSLNPDASAMVSPTLSPGSLRSNMIQFMRYGHSDGALANQRQSPEPHTLSPSHSFKHQLSVRFADEPEHPSRSSLQQTFDMLASQPHRTITITQLAILLNTYMRRTISIQHVYDLMEDALTREEFNQFQEVRKLQQEPTLTESEFIRIIEASSGWAEKAHIDKHVVKQHALQSLEKEALMAVKDKLGRSLDGLQVKPKPAPARHLSMPIVPLSSDHAPPDGCAGESPAQTNESGALQHNQRPRLPRRLALSRALLNSNELMGVSTITDLSWSGNNLRTQQVDTVRVFTSKNARLGLARYFNSPIVQAIIVFLIIADAFVVMLEVLLFAFPCSVPVACHPADLVFHETEHVEMCFSSFEHTCHTIHANEGVLRLMGRILLFIFAGQIGTLLVLLGRRFFWQPFFVLDLVVISGAVMLEFLQSLGGALVIIVVFWRFIRVAHALTSTIDMHLARAEAKEIEAQSDMMKAARMVQREMRAKSKRCDTLIKALDTHENGLDIELMNKQQLLEALFEQRKRTELLETQFIDLETTLSVVSLHIETQKQQFQQELAKNRFAQAVWNDVEA
eukprot:c52445_g1_i1.p1 GENE.c52445_g1_i1~~c52445_g1_i1.p1  ORF type:complete len:708 (+),score=153.90 c52445_g1_i1:73-2196(+)